MKAGDHVVTTSLEHNAVIRPLHSLSGTRGVSYTVVKCDEKGRFDINDFARDITDKTTMFAINHASNVTGTILPVRGIADIAKERGITMLLDAAQSAGSIEVDATRLGVDLLAFAGHKGLPGPAGTGGLYIRDGITLDPLMEGGTGSDSLSLLMPQNLPERFEAGTLNYPGICGLKEALKYINSTGVDKIREKELAIIKRMIDGLRSLRHITLYGCKEADGITGVFAFNVAGMAPAQAAHKLDMEHNIMVRAGLHCAPLAHESIGTADTGTLRASIGYATTMGDIDRFISALETLRP